MALRLHDKILDKIVREYSGQCGGCVLWERNIPPENPRCGICLAGRGETLETDYYRGRCYQPRFDNEPS